jgi:hypothetical protein
MKYLIPILLLASSPAYGAVGNIEATVCNYTLQGDIVTVDCGDYSYQYQLLPDCADGTASTDCLLTEVVPSCPAGVCQVDCVCNSG